jgi:hypothetical protein
MQQWCKRVEGEREAMEQQLMRVEGERIKEQIAAVVERAAGRTASESADENRAEASKERLARMDLEYEVKELKEEVAELKAAASRRRGAAPEPEEEVEENPVVLLCKQHAEDRAEITINLAKVNKTMKGVIEVLGMLANAQAGVAKPKSCYATPSGACKRKHDGRGGDRKSALYKLQKQMGPTAAPQLK